MRDRYGEPVPPEPTIIVHNHHHQTEAHTHIGDSDHTDQWKPAPNPAAEQELVDLVNHDPEYRAWWKSWLNYCRQTLGINEDS